MFVKWMKFIVLALVSSSLFILAHNGFTPESGSPIPPLGKVLDPFSGFWKNGDKSDDFQDELTLSGLNGDVEVLWDDRMVPHIISGSSEDLYFTQGYISAKNRLWQMDFMSRAAMGRLSEVVGPRAIELDRFYKRIGLKRSAALSMDELKNHPDDWKMVLAYTDGVNAYIKSLKYKDYPIEYKILDYRPESWSPLKSLSIMKYMAWDLDGNFSEKHTTGARTLFGKEEFDRNFPLLSPYFEPIVKENLANVEPFESIVTQPSLDQTIGGKMPEPSGDGSNNWAVAGSKTRSGFPILADDPHLTLRLPSLWYENQLFGPNINVYGVSIPGMPGVIIGFNENISWGLTYAGSDSVDYYKLEQSKDGSSYETASGNKAFTYSIDTIFVKGGGPVIDTTKMTVFGPLVYDDGEFNEAYYNYMIPEGAAMQWTAHLPSLEMKGMRLLNGLKRHEDMVKWLDYYNAPGQNFVYATPTDIGIWHNGLYPKRSETEGRFISEAKAHSGAWSNFYDRDELPHSLNPSMGFLSNGNQSPLATSDHYLGGDDYVSFERGNRIDEVLDTLTGITIYDMQLLQLDIRSELPELVLPALLEAMEDAELSEEQTDVLNEIVDWNYEYTTRTKAAVVFEKWMTQLSNDIWEDEGSNATLAWSRPNGPVTAQLLLADESPYYDNKTTEDVTESRSEIIQNAFASVVAQLTEELGGLNENWEWSNYRGTDINHFANIDGFSRKRLPTSGDNSTVNSIKKTHGPSWRMIIEMSDPIKAHGIYPGGQSGNPGSAYYDNFVDDWVSGNYYDLHFVTNPADNEFIVSTSTLKAK